MHAFHVVGWQVHNDVLWPVLWFPNQERPSCLPDPGTKPALADLVEHRGVEARAEGQLLAQERRGSAEAIDQAYAEAESRIEALHTEVVRAEALAEERLTAKLAQERRTGPSTGRVRLPKFYGANKDGGRAACKSGKYLRELGALDETSSWMGQAGHRSQLHAGFLELHCHPVTLLGLLFEQG